MTALEIVTFWKAFAAHQNFDDSIIAKGESAINDEPEYWANETMWKLFDCVSN